MIMRNRSFRLVVATLAAIGITVVIRITSRDPATTYRQVVVVVQPTEVNAPLDSRNLTIKRLPAIAIPTGALESIPSGALAAQPLWPGQFLLPEMTATSSILRPRPEDRVIGIPVTLATAGTIEPGDRVDVLLFTADPKRGNAGMSHLILSGLTVVQVLNQYAQAVDPTSGKLSGSAAVPAVVEVMVSASQTPVLADALHSGTITLARYLPESQPVALESVPLSSSPADSHGTSGGATE